MWIHFFVSASGKRDASQSRAHDARLDATGIWDICSGTISCHAYVPSLIGKHYQGGSSDKHGHLAPKSQGLNSPVFSLHKLVSVKVGGLFVTFKGACKSDGLRHQTALTLSRQLSQPEADMLLQLDQDSKGSWSCYALVAREHSKPARFNLQTIEACGCSSRW